MNALLIACIIAFNPVCDEEDDDRPPPRQTLLERADDLAMPTELPTQSQAPWLSEELADKAREVIELEAEIGRLEGDVKALESDIETLSDLVQLTDGNTIDNVDESTAQAVGSTYEATHYTAYCEGCSGITYSGHDLRQSIYDAEGRRIVAVDPSVIAIGSVLRVIYADGMTFTAIASDVGGDIKGSRIDIAVETKEEAYRLGRQSVTVEIVK